MLRDATFLFRVSDKSCISHEGGWHTVQTVSSPEQILHVLRHDSRDILQVFVQLIQLTRLLR
jgi:hypothetical protein